MPCLDVPDPDRMVFAGTGQKLAVGAEGDVPNPVGVTLKYGLSLTGADIPQPDVPIIACRCNEFTTGAESD